MKRRQYLGQVFTAGAVLLAGCQSIASSDVQPSGDDCEIQSDRQQQAEILEDSLGTATQSGITRIKGKIKNKGNRPITYVKIRATFYSENGSVIASGVDRRINIDPGETQTFRVFPPTDKTVNVSEVSEYELTLEVVEACV